MDGQLNPGVLGYNMFAYCENNPVNGSDPDGNMAWWAAAALGGAAWGVASYLIGNAISGQKSTWKGAAKAALTGAITGVAFSAIGKGIQAVSKAAKAVNGVNVQKAKDFTSEAKAVLKSLDRSSGYTKSTLTAGRNIHKGYKVGLRGAKEFGAVKGIRPDYVDFKKGIIYELKPNNPRGIKQGITQLHKYNEALGGGFKLVLEVY